MSNSIGSVAAREPGSKFQLAQLIHGGTFWLCLLAACSFLLLAGITQVWLPLRESVFAHAPLIFALVGCSFAVHALVQQFQRPLDNNLTGLCNVLSRMATDPQEAPTDIALEPAYETLVQPLRNLTAAMLSSHEQNLQVKTSNRVLAMQLRRVYNVLDTLDVGVVAVDKDARVLFANRASGTFLKTFPIEAEGKEVKEIFCYEQIPLPPDSSTEIRDDYAVQCTELELELDGSPVIYAVTLCQVKNTDGDVIGAVWQFANISRLRNMEVVQSDFVDSVAHELRTPITSIRAYIEMLIDDEATDTQAKYDFYNIIYEETYRLSSLIDNLLNISMLEAGSAHMDITPTRLKRLLLECMDVIRPQCEKKNIKLVMNLPDRLPTLDIDKSLFGMALINILSNATKYTPDEGTVSIEEVSAELDIRLVIQDTGIGIPEQELPRIFEKFYRSSNAADEKGSGVGLATALQILRAHGGDIHVASQVGQGTVFTLVLPRTLINTSIGE